MTKVLYHEVAQNFDLGGAQRTARTDLLAPSVNAEYSETYDAHRSNKY
jgi:hypothetical protein